MRTNGMKIILIIVVMLVMMNLPTFFTSSATDNVKLTLSDNDNVELTSSDNDNVELTSSDNDNVELTLGDTDNVELTLGDTLEADRRQRPVPSYVLPGDIMMFDLKPGALPWYWFFYYIPGHANDHCAIYIGNNMFIHAGESGVAIRGITHFTRNFTNFTFVRVTSADAIQRQNALDWALSMEGFGYQVVTMSPWFFQKCEDPAHIGVPGHELFYCFEFAWAAYYNQGIDIDCNGWTRDSPGLLGLVPGVWGNNILEDTDITPILTDYQFN
ncbi:MAG: hypothetical protein NT038_00865 [Euryarchaeota archaeon]|nr:hypothetical protein [Euryarchaeota archaeon]